MEMIIPSSRRPDITFHASGEIHITARVARLLALSPESCINIARHNGEFLLLAEPATLGAHRARCREVNPRSRYLRANSVCLARVMLDACGAARKAALMCGQPITLKGKTCIPIITKTVL